jgi:hypothetical protein
MGRRFLSRSPILAFSPQTSPFPRDWRRLRGKEVERQAGDGQGSGLVRLGQAVST